MERTIESTLLHIIRRRLLEDFPVQIAECLDALDDEQVWWRPNEQSNAVGNLIVHLSWSNRYYLEQIIAGRDIGRDRNEEFAVRGGLSLAQVRETWNESLRVVAEILGGLDPSQLMRKTDRTGKSTTYAQLLLHVSHHNAIHLGQILWITKMLRPGVIDDVGMRVHAR